MIEKIKNETQKWVLIACGIFILNFFSHLYNGYLLGVEFNSESVGGFLLLSLILTGLLSGSGYLGAKVFFFFMLFFNLLAISYMLYITLSHAAPNWEDIISMISFMIVIGLGLIFGVIGQVIYNAKKK